MIISQLDKQSIVYDINIIVFTKTTNYQKVITELKPLFKIKKRYLFYLSRAKREHNYYKVSYWKGKIRNLNQTIHHEKKLLFESPDDYYKRKYGAFWKTAKENQQVKNNPEIT